jgi:sulfopyruvate decarboxylase TPP-binding subunit
MLSLTRVCRFPLLILVTMRGEAGEFNPWQMPMGANSAELLRLSGVAVSRADEVDQVGPAVAEAAQSVFENPAGQPGAAAVLIAQKLVGIKTFDIEAGDIESGDVEAGP